MLKNIILLPTNNESVICGTKELYYRGLHPQIDSLQNHHLYILSDEEIKNGDYHINIINNKISNYNLGKLNPNYKNYKKIIATTDTSLYILDEPEYPRLSFSNQSPQIPHPFIQYYITEYNKGNIITEVNVEYKDYSIPNGTKSYVSNTGDIIDISCKLVINPDNTINIIIMDNIKIH